jgi:Uma2 family endonuclease
MHRLASYTVDDLFTLPDWGARAEVLDGRLLLTPPPPRRHARVVDNLTAHLRPVLPSDVMIRRDAPIRMPGGDGPVPDLMVTGGGAWPRGYPAAVVHTVVEVVLPDGRFVDRVWKRERYEEAGIACYWRVELAPWPRYRGPLPLLVVRVREPGGWRDILAAAGRIESLPPAGDAALPPIKDKSDPIRDQLTPPSP